MNTGRTVFAQIMDFLPLREFRECVKRYHGNYKVQKFSCMDQFLCMAFAQLSYIFAPTHDVEGDVPIENILAFIDEIQGQKGYVELKQKKKLEPVFIKESKFRKKSVSKVSQAIGD